MSFIGPCPPSFATMKTMPVAALLILLVVLTTVGCQQDTATEPTRTQSANTIPEDFDYTGKKIGVSMYTLGAPYFKAQLDAAKRIIESVGATCIYTEAQDDMVKQLGSVEDMLAQGIDLLILNPQDPQGLIPATQAATRAGVPVIIMDSSVLSPQRGSAV